MEKTSFAALGLVLALSLCILGACTKTDAAKAAGETEAATGLTEGFSPSQVVYVAPAAGLNLRGDASAAGKLIKTLPQNTRLVVLEKGQNEETVSGATGFWYRVDTGKEAGWVFGAHIISKSDTQAGTDEICTNKFPLEMKISWWDHGDELTGTAIRTIGRRRGYVIYLPQGAHFRETDKYDVINYWVTMRLYEVKRGAPLPENKNIPGEDEHIPYAILAYKHVAVGDKTLEIEIKYVGEAMYAGSSEMDAVVGTIRPLK